MGINIDKPHLWKSDINCSVDFYNSWFLEFAPQAFREVRNLTAGKVLEVFRKTNFLYDITPKVLADSPDMLSVLRMTACPPIARDRLVGLAKTSKSLVQNMEDKAHPHISPQMTEVRLQSELFKVTETLKRLLDFDLFVWLREGRLPSEKELQRSAAVVADRLCGAVANPIIRNEQEKRQLSTISKILSHKGYRFIESGVQFDHMEAGTFSFHVNVPVFLSGKSGAKVNIPVDVAIMPSIAKKNAIPLLMEAKSAGDFTNVNKRRKEEAVKMQQLKNTFGNHVSYTLFLCGYFDSGYLGYEAAEGIDWVWEHRTSDLEKLGI